MELDINLRVRVHELEKVLEEKVGPCQILTLAPRFQKLC